MAWELGPPQAAPYKQPGAAGGGWRARRPLRHGRKRPRRKSSLAHFFRDTRRRNVRGKHALRNCLHRERLHRCVPGSSTRVLPHSDARDNIKCVMRSARRQILRAAGDGVRQRREEGRSKGKGKSGGKGDIPREVGYTSEHGSPLAPLYRQERLAASTPKL